MHHLYYLMGKSASGKDTIYKRLLELFPALKPMILYTTRPKRAGEQEGKTYYFITQDQLAEMTAADRFIEMRTYHTKKGDWTYCTAKDSIDLASGSYLGIGTPESCEKLRDHFGAERVIPIYIEVEDGLRLQRAPYRKQPLPYRGSGSPSLR